MNPYQPTTGVQVLALDREFPGPPESPLDPVLDAVEPRQPRGTVEARVRRLLVLLLPGTGVVVGIIMGTLVVGLRVHRGGTPPRHRESGLENHEKLKDIAFQGILNLLHLNFGWQGRQDFLCMLGKVGFNNRSFLTLIFSIFYRILL